MDYENSFLRVQKIYDNNMQSQLMSKIPKGQIYLPKMKKDINYSIQSGSTTHNR
jgi:hypothetical protein